MKIMMDITDALHDWTGLLSDLQLDLEDLESSILHYNPLNDSLFLDEVEPFIDELVESEDELLDEIFGSKDPHSSDDIVTFIKNSAETLLRESLDIFVGRCGYEIGRIIKVFMTSLTGVILALMDVIPIDSDGELLYADVS